MQRTMRSGTAISSCGGVVRSYLLRWPQAPGPSDFDGELSYDQFLSILMPVQLVTWELEK
jgi:hypothetical protein